MTRNEFEARLRRALRDPAKREALLPLLARVAEMGVPAAACDAESDPAFNAMVTGLFFAAGTLGGIAYALSLTPN